jgi:hypothetical protein
VQYPKGDSKMFDFKERNMEENNGCMQSLTLVFIENQEIEQVYEPDTALPEVRLFRISISLSVREV